MVGGKKSRGVMKWVCGSLFVWFAQTSLALPQDFVYLKTVAPSILQDLRYAGTHNFLGRKAVGYETPTCILTRNTAQALAVIQRQLLAQGLSLKVYDCYRPTAAVSDFWEWSQTPGDARMRAEFYPRVPKAHLFAAGYIALQSGHSRGSTVDLTIVPLPARKEPVFNANTPLVACFAPNRYADNMLDFGTGYDCLDEAAHVFAAGIPERAHQNRLLLRHLMQQYGFVPYDQEWWHFTYRAEIFPQTYFNFLVQ